MRRTDGANPRSGVDAGFTLCLQLVHHWSGAADSGRCAIE
jgi:hypothetical protein